MVLVCPAPTASVTSHGAAQVARIPVLVAIATGAPVMLPALPRRSATASVMVEPAWSGNWTLSVTWTHALAMASPLVPVTVLAAGEDDGSALVTGSLVMPPPLLILYL